MEGVENRKIELHCQVGFYLIIDNMFNEAVAGMDMSGFSSGGCWSSEDVRWMF